MRTRKTRLMPRAAKGEAAKKKTEPKSAKTGVAGGRKAAGRPRGPAGKAMGKKAENHRVRACPSARVGADVRADVRADARGANDLGFTGTAAVRKKKRLFLDALAAGDGDLQAERAARINWKLTVRVWTAPKSEEYDKAFADEYNRLKDAEYYYRRMKGQDISWDRAINGVRVPIHHNGARVDERVVYSDTLLLAELKANNPERYRDRTETKHEGSFTLVNKTADPVPLPPELARPAPGRDKP